MPEGEIILHVGYPKTGTTTLQDALFADGGSFSYLGKFSASKGRAFAGDWVEGFRDLVNFGLTPHVADAREALAATMAESVAGAENRRAVISLEGFTNPLVDYKYTQSKDVFVKADHLWMLFDPVIARGIDVKIVITLRNQVDIIPSMFAQTYFYGVSCGIFGREYDEFLDFVLDDRVFGFGPNFEFGRVMRHYASRFGAANVHVFDMEGLFSGEVSDEIAALAAVLGLGAEEVLERIGANRQNTRRVEAGTAVRYRVMPQSPAIRMAADRVGGLPIHRGAFGPLDRLRLRFGKPVHITLPDRSARIRAHYAPSNAELKAGYGIDFR
ncbi:sulfotransferase domain-containing protein [Rhodobacteraceae bacterium NNCM2]|nr:sulfotransferase domain-containing protein [Coraliihabitans acroporae]